MMKLIFFYLLLIITIFGFCDVIVAMDQGQKAIFRKNASLIEKVNGKFVARRTEDVLSTKSMKLSAQQENCLRRSLSKFENDGIFPQLKTIILSSQIIKDYYEKKERSFFWEIIYPNPLAALPDFNTIKNLMPQQLLKIQGETIILPFINKLNDLTMGSSGPEVKECINNLNAIQSKLSSNLLADGEIKEFFDWVAKQFKNNSNKGKVYEFLKSAPDYLMQNLLKNLCNNGVYCNVGAALTKEWQSFIVTENNLGIDLAEKQEKASLFLQSLMMVCSKIMRNELYNVPYLLGQCLDTHVNTSLDRKIKLLLNDKKTYKIAYAIQDMVTAIFLIKNKPQNYNIFSVKIPTPYRDIIIV